MRASPAPAEGVFRILIVEDDPLLRTVLAAALTGDDTRIVDSVATAADGMAVAERSAIDVLLTDLDLGHGPTGAVLAHALRRAHPQLGVVVLTSYTDPRLVGAKLSQLPAGAEYLLKQSVRDLGMLRTAVLRAAARGAAPLPDGPAGAGPHLTDAQIETMRLVAEGLSNAEIASRRVITEKSVEVAVSRIIKQLGLERDRSRNARVEIARTYYAMTGARAAADTHPA